MHEDHIITIADTQVKSGQRKLIRAEIARLPTHNSIDIPIYIERSKLPGPTVLLMAGMHGDETNGIEIMRRLMHEKYNKPVKGTIISIPIYNIYGFLNQSRGLPDGRDLNRSFPGTKSGSLASRMAHFFTDQVLPTVDFIIDFHTGGARRTNFPQIRASFEDPKARELAQAFATPYIIDSPLRDKSLRKVAFTSGKTVIIYEGGETLRLRKNVIDTGVRGTLRALRHLGIRNDEVLPPASQPIEILRSKWIRAKRSGLYHNRIRNGEKVKTGEILGLITDTYGKYEAKVKAPADSYVIGLNNHPVVNQGDPLIHIGFSDL